jgi:hypothetical protein
MPCIVLRNELVILPEEHARQRKPAMIFARWDKLQPLFGERE